MFFTSGSFAYVCQKRSCIFRRVSEKPEMCEEGGVNWYWLTDLNTLSSFSVSLMILLQTTHFI